LSLADEATHAHLYAADPASDAYSADPYPDWELRLGPRGGVRRTRVG
jgi:hypothetical protein